MMYMIFGSLLGQKNIRERCAAAERDIIKRERAMKGSSRLRQVTCPLAKLHRHEQAVECLTLGVADKSQ